MGSRHYWLFQVLPDLVDGLPNWVQNVPDLITRNGITGILGIFWGLIFIQWTTNLYCNFFKQEWVSHDSGLKSSSLNGWAWYVGPLFKGCPSQPSPCLCLSITVLKGVHNPCTFVAFGSLFKTIVGFSFWTFLSVFFNVCSFCSGGKNISLLTP